MPPRHTFWTIILEGKPTAFRANTSEELLPTLRQLQSRHPDAVMMWFARGRLWESPEKQREATLNRAGRRDRRGPDWRPGGEHRDPRARFEIPRDEKRRRFSERLRRDRDERGEHARGPARSDKQSRGFRPTGARGPRRPAAPRGGFRKPGGGRRGGK